MTKWFEDHKDKVTWPVYVDNKFDGIRCERWKKGAFSRKGEEFHTIPHIINATEYLFDRFPDLVLDGELFNEDVKLSKMSGLVSVNTKPKDLTPELLAESGRYVRFYVYDAYGFADIKKETPFLERRQALQRLLAGVPFVVPVQHEVANNEGQIRKTLEQKRKEGKEGIIIRWGRCEYENKRSKFLLKMKVFETDEFQVTDIEEGTADWAGAAKIIYYRVNKGIAKGEIHKANIEGSYPELAEIYQNRAKYIGKWATIEFQCYSEYGVPLIPYVRAFRCYE